MVEGGGFLNLNLDSNLLVSQRGEAGGHGGALVVIGGTLWGSSWPLNTPETDLTLWQTPQAKQTAMEELTAGQAAVLVRNEQDIDRTTEELEDLEETLNESIADSLRGAKQKAGGADPSKKKKKRCAHQ